MVHIINVFIYLHVIDTCFKVIIAIFYFCHPKNPSNIIKTIFNPKNSLLHKYKKQMWYTLFL